MIISIIRWIFAYFDEAAKLCKASNDADNFGGLLILQDLLNERVAKGDVSNPHDFWRLLATTAPPDSNLW